MKTAAPASPLHRTGFLRQISGTLATRMLLIALGAVSAIVIARSLTPAARGLYAVAVTLAALAAQVGNLGLHATHTQTVARAPDSLDAVVGNILVVSGAAGLLLAAVTGVVWIVAPALAPLQGPTLVLTMLWAPLNLATFLFVNLLIGLHAVGAANRLELGNRVLSLILLLGVVTKGWQSVPVLVALAVAAQVATFALALVTLHRLSGVRPRPSRTLLSRTVRQGVSLWLTTLLCYLLTRLDLLLLHYLGTPADTGYYASALTLTDVVMVLPGTICNLLFPRLVGDDAVAARWHFTQKTTRVTALVLAPVLVMLAVGSPWIVPLLFGKAYVPAALVVMVMAPGLFCIGLETVFVQFLNGQGLPMGVPAIWALVVAGNVGLNLWLIPRAGCVGAALASSICNVMATMAIGWLCLRMATRLSAEPGCGR